MPLAPGDVIGGFVIEARLGGGGMGQVFRARDPKLDRRVALKVLDVTHLGPEGLLRFRREAELAARVDALGGVVRVHARGVHEGTPFMVMELVEGHDLEQLLAHERVDTLRVVALLEQVARTLQRCHELGVVHRDLKPGNILVRAADGAPLVVDFGLARAVDGERLTQTGAFMGTPAYMAPEQAVDGARAVDPRVDVYALGAVLYRVLAGRSPPSIAARLNREVAPPSKLAGVRVDPRLEAICLRAMTHDPERRPPTAVALADALAAVLADPTDEAGSRRRRRTVVVVAASVAAAVACGVVLGAVSARGLARGRAAARERALARARALEATVVPALLLSDVGPVTTLDPGALRAAADEVLDAPGGAPVAERLVACARLLEGAPPSRRPPADPVARAADALLAARSEGAARALRRLATDDPGEATSAVQARLTTHLAAPDLVAWAATVRGTPAGERARPRVLAALAGACRAAASAGEAQRAAEELLTAAADPALAREAIDAAASAWERELVGAVERDARSEIAVLGRLQRLVERSGAPAGPSVRRAVERVFAALHARMWQGRELAGKRAQLVAWDEAAAAFDLELVVPPEHVTFLRTLVRGAIASDLPAAFTWACARRGADADGGFAWENLAVVRLASAEPLRAGPGEPSAAVRFVELAAATYQLMTARPSSPPGSTLMIGLDPTVRESFCAGLERVLEAERQDLSPRYLAETHALLAEGRLEEARDLPAGDPRRAPLLQAARTHALLRLGMSVADAPLVQRCAFVLSDVSAELGEPAGAPLIHLELAAAEVLRALSEELYADRVDDLREDLCRLAHLRTVRLLAAGRAVEAVAVLRAMFEVVPEPPVAGSLPALLDALADPRHADVIMDAFRYDTGDPKFTRRVIARDLARGRHAEARALLERARCAAPSYPGWAELEAELR